MSLESVEKLLEQFNSFPYTSIEGCTPEYARVSLFEECRRTVFLSIPKNQCQFNPYDWKYDGSKMLKCLDTINGIDSQDR